VDQVPERAAQELLGRPAGEIAGGGIDVDDLPVGLRDDQWIARQLEQPALELRRADVGM
jgi:hypothetical protein